MRWAAVAEAFAAGDRWLLPGACLACGGAVGPDDPLCCAPCRSRWRSLPEPQCTRCGQPLTRLAPECRLCAEWPEGLGRVRSAVWLDDAARRAVHGLKYGGWSRLAPLLAARMVRCLPPGPPGVLVPVPLGAARLRTRGYNQAERLAAALGDAAGWQVRPGWAVRTRETGTQTALTPEARRANVAGAFAAGPLTPGARVVLADDVFTTGATLVELAAVLLEAGASTVEAVTFARARPPLG